MPIQSRYRAVLVGFGVLIACTSTGRAQRLYPPGLEVAPVAADLVLPTGNRLQAAPEVDGLTSRLEFPQFSRYYAAAEAAVLFTAAVHFNDQFAAVGKDTSVFLSPRVSVGRLFDDGDAIRLTYRNLSEVGRTGKSYVLSGNWRDGNSFSTNWFDLDYVSREFAPLT